METDMFSTNDVVLDLSKPKKVVAAITEANVLDGNLFSISSNYESENNNMIHIDGEERPNRFIACTDVNCSNWGHSNRDKMSTGVSGPPTITGTMAATVIDKKFKCTECSYTTMYRKCLHTHMGQHSVGTSLSLIRKQVAMVAAENNQSPIVPLIGDNLLSNHFDKRGYSARLSPTTHRIPTAVQPITSHQFLACPYCQFTAPDKYILAQHLVRYHPYYVTNGLANNMLCELLITPAGALYGCIICGESSAFKANISKHIFSHCNAIGRMLPSEGRLDAQGLLGYKLSSEQPIRKDFPGKSYPPHLAALSGDNGVVPLIVERPEYWQEASSSYYMDKMGHESSTTAAHGGECGLVTEKNKFAALRKAESNKQSTQSEKPFKCPLCSYSTLYENCLKTHKAKHSPAFKDILKSGLMPDLDECGKVYKCRECNYSTMYKSCLATHMLRHRTSLLGSKYSHNSNNVVQTSQGRGVEEATNHKRYHPYGTPPRGSADSERQFSPGVMAPPSENSRSPPKIAMETSGRYSSPKIGDPGTYVGAENTSSSSPREARQYLVENPNFVKSRISAFHSPCREDMQNAYSGVANSNLTMRELPKSSDLLMVPSIETRPIELTDAQCSRTLYKAPCSIGPEAGDIELAKRYQEYFMSLVDSASREGRDASLSRQGGKYENTFDPRNFKSHRMVNREFLDSLVVPPMEAAYGSRQWHRCGIHVAEPSSADTNCHDNGSSFVCNSCGYMATSKFDFSIHLLKTQHR